MELLKKCRRIVALILLSNIIMLCNASVAYPGMIDFRQPDGSVVKIKLRGDENLKWAETEDGYTLLYDKVGNLVYAKIDTKGDLVPSEMVATDIGKRPIEVQRELKSTPKKLFFSLNQRNAAKLLHQSRVIQRTSGPQKAVTGTRRMLLILVDYPDCAFQKSKSDFEKLVNQVDYTENGRIGSVRDYYRENSFGQLDLITDVAGVYRLSNNRAYYGANTTSGANDIRPREMAEEAIRMANNDVNFANYSGVHIIYAGYGEEAGGGGDCIWAHSWTLSMTVDGVSLSNYSCSPELRGNSDSLITNIGVICHEIGHVLGTSDFYDTDYATNGEYPGTGSWDLMAEGNWNRAGACPAHFNPYTKIYDFGWANVTTVNGASSHKLSAKSQDGFVRINTKTSNEFFLLEYRSQKGFDTDLFGHGLMIYRASEGLSKKGSNTINASHKQQFYPVVANASYQIPTSDPSSYGNVDSYTAPYPGNLGVDEILDISTPSMKSWNGQDTEMPITSIKENIAKEYVTFDVAADFTYTSIEPAVGDAESLSKITINFPKAAYINANAGNISIRSNSDGNNYGAYISVNMSLDNFSATITCSPSYSKWTVGQTYTMTIPEGYFVSSSNNRAYEAISCSWTIVPETFTYCNVSPTLGELQEIKDILISFPNDIIVSNGSSFPTLYMRDKNGSVVRTITTYKTKDANNNSALMGTVSPSITELGRYTISFPAGVLSNDSYGSMKNRAFDLVWDVVLPPVVPQEIKPVGSEVSDLSRITITFNESVVVNPQVGLIDPEISEVDPDTGEFKPIIDEISIVSDDPNNCGKDFRVEISDDGLTATIICSPNYGSGWTVGKTYTLNVPPRYFIGASGGTNKIINRSWLIVPERLFPSEITPAEGEIGYLDKVEIGFSKTVYLNGTIRGATIKDANGNEIPISAIGRNNNVVYIEINPAVTTPGTYTLHIPSGQISDQIRFMDGLHNGDIRVSWNVIPIPVNSVSIDRSELTMEIAQTMKLEATVLPSTATNKTLYWRSSDESIAIVNQNGEVTSLRDGEVVITATTTDGSNLISACLVTVSPIQVTSLDIDKEEVILKIGETSQLLTSIIPEIATDFVTVVWSSLDNTVATVDQNGVVTANGVGKTIIVAEVAGTDVKDMCEVSVMSILGDANNDGLLTISDIVVTASYILGDEIQGFVPAGVDINADRKVNVTDIILLVNLVLDSPSQSSRTLFKAPQYDNSNNQLYIEDFVIDAGETKQLAIKLDNTNAFTAFQVDIRLPEGIELCQDSNGFMMTLSERKGNDHALISVLRNDGAIRLLSYSLGLNEYSDYDGELVYLTVRAAENYAGTSQITLDNIAFVESNREEHFFTPTSANVIGNIVTGVADADAGVVITTRGNDIIIANVSNGVEVKVYSADGALIRSEKSVGDTICIEAPVKGIYLIKVGTKTVKVII